VNEYTTQTCSKCGNEYPFTTEYFYWRSKAKGTLQRQCKGCVKQRTKDWNKDNREYVAEKNQERYHQNREQNRARARDYYQRNKEHIKTKTKAYAEAHKEETKAYHAARYTAKRDQMRAQMRENYKRNPQAYVDRAAKWVKDNPERAQESARRREHRRRARELSVAIDFSPEDHRYMLDYFGHRCAVCGRTADLFTVLSVDHWMPISKGGGTTRDNLVPLCHTKQGCSNGVVSCNGSKNNKLPDDWLAERYDKRKAKQIANRIQAYFDSLK